MTMSPKPGETPCAEQENQVCERHFSPAQIAELWSLSPDKVRRMFQNEPGVLVIKNANRKYRKRDYRTLRIPQRVVERVHRRLTKV
jgi:hypothetical protein